MNIIKKMFLFIKKVFVNHDKVKELQEPKISIKQEEKATFIKSLRMTTTEKEEKRKVETLACDGDGLGIQKNITC